MRLFDKQLARRIQNGDVEAYEYVINTYKSRLLSYCLRMCGNYHDAEELAQDVFVQVYRCINQYDPATGAISTWIFRIAHNRCINHLRSPKYREAGFISIPEGYGSESAEPWTRLNDRMLIIAALNRLDSADRELLLLKDYLDLKIADISKILDIPGGTVKSRLHSARKRLKKILEDGDKL